MTGLVRPFWRVDQTQIHHFHTKPREPRCKPHHFALEPLFKICKLVPIDVKADAE